MNVQQLQKDRQAAIDWAKAIIENKDAIILDTETTGLYGEVCQLSMIDMQGNPLMDTLVKPTCPIERGARLIHGITDAMVKNAPRFDEISGELSKIITGKAVVIYNAEFDIARLTQSARARGANPSPVVEWHCAMLRYAAYCGEWNDYHGNYRWQKLPGGDHTALGDCKATLEIITQMAKGEDNGSRMD